MRKFTILEAAEKLGVSKEAIYNRIRRKSIKFTEENGVRYVFLNETSTKNSQNFEYSIKEKKSEDTNFINYLLQEISELKAKNEQLSQDKDELWREKEDILIQSKNEIKEIFFDRDEKLKYFLNLLSSPKNSNLDEEKQIEFIDAQIEDEWLSVDEYINALDLSPEKEKKIHLILMKNLQKSKFLKVIDGILYIKKGVNIKHFKEKI